jgi:hypothetical protein
MPPTLSRGTVGCTIYIHFEQRFLLIFGQSRFVQVHF